MSKWSVSCVGGARCQKERHIVHCDRGEGIAFFNVVDWWLVFVFFRQMAKLEPRDEGGIAAWDRC